MFWKKKEEKLVGASAKLEAAARMKEAGRIAAHEDSEGQTSAQTLPVLVVFVLAIALVFTADAGHVVNTTAWHPTGISGLDAIISGSGTLNIVGSSDIDAIIMIVLRAIVLCVFTGFIPLLGLLISNSAKKGAVSPFVACWAATIAIPFLYILLGMFL